MRTLQSRKEIIQGLNKDDKEIGAESSKERQGGDGGRAEEEEEEDKPETLPNLTLKGWVILGFHFTVIFQNN